MAETVLNTDEIAQKLGMAREKAQQGLSDDAHILYEEIIDLDRGNLPALTENGFLYLKHGGYEPAMMWIETARAVGDSEALKIGAAECFLHLGLTDDAIEVLMPVIEQSPLSIKARLLLGLALTQMEDADEALLHAQVVLTIEAENAIAKAIKATNMCQMGLKNESIAFWKTRTDENKEEAALNEFSTFLFAQALFEQDCLEECISHVDELLKLNDAHVEGLMLKSNALEELGRIDESDAVLEIVSRLTADMPEYEAP